MTTSYDTIELKIIPGGVEYECWADCTRCGILINGIDIRTHVVAASDNLRQEAGIEPEGEKGFGHLDPKELYNELKDALFTGNRAYVLCCGGCGEAGCYSARCRVTLENDCYLWHDFTTIHDWDLGLRFRFKKEDYEDFISQIRTTPIEWTDGEIIKWWERME